jgi:hypothetical protein
MATYWGSQAYYTSGGPNGEGTWYQMPDDTGGDLTPPPSGDGSSGQTIKELYVLIMNAQPSHIDSLAAQWQVMHDMLDTIKSQLFNESTTLYDETWKSGDAKEAFMKFGPGPTLAYLDEWMNAALSNKAALHNLASIIRDYQGRMKTLYDEYDKAVKDAKHVGYWTKTWDAANSWTQSQYDAAVAEDASKQVTEQENHYNLEAQKLAYSMANEIFSQTLSPMGSGHGPVFMPPNAVLNKPGHPPFVNIGGPGAPPPPAPPPVITPPNLTPPPGQPPSQEQLNQFLNITNPPPQPQLDQPPPPPVEEVNLNQPATGGPLPQFDSPPLDTFNPALGGPVPLGLGKGLPNNLTNNLTQPGLDNPNLTNPNQQGLFSKPVNPPNLSQSLSKSTFGKNSLQNPSRLPPQLPNFGKKKPGKDGFSKEELETEQGQLDEHFNQGNPGVSPPVLKQQRRREQDRPGGARELPPMRTGDSKTPQIGEKPTQPVLRRNPDGRTPPGLPGQPGRGRGPRDRSRTGDPRRFGPTEGDWVGTDEFRQSAISPILHSRPAGEFEEETPTPGTFRNRARPQGTGSGRGKASGPSELTNRRTVKRTPGHDQPVETDEQQIITDEQAFTVEGAGGGVIGGRVEDGSQQAAPPPTVHKDQRRHRTA